MEREKIKAGSWSGVAKATCWDVVWGCMEDVVTLESSLDLDSDQGIGVRSKPYVVLRRPQPHSGPCQITIDFAQHREIKQVYVRSSARVYEIYYAASTKGDNDYLCTVRCGAVPSHEILDAITSETHSTTANDDGWVDIKQTSLPMQNHNFQYLYEATAEVADADPVLSVTLRLLSIQSGDYVRIDEVYVFTEPVVSADMDSSENSSGNALMSMLIPTFMQLSKSQMSRIQERNDTSPGEIDEKKSNTNALRSIDMSKLQKPDPISSPPVTGRDTLSNHIERSLDELVSRVTKIEQFCLKFEEKLLKPISNMEARLVKIEQQLESFVSSQNSRTSCTEISAPESESNYMCNDGTKCHLTSTNMDDCLVQEPSIPPSDTSLAPCYVQCLTTTVPHLLPSLVVTAPDFSNIDDVEENDSAETVKNSSNECPKKPPSLSDALASALAGFLSSASADSLSCSFKVEAAADFIQSDEPVPPSIHVNEEAKRTTSVSYMEQGSPDKQEYDLEKDGNKKQVDSYVIDKAIAEVGFVGSDDDINLYLDSPVPVGSGPSENESACTLQVPGSRTNSCKVTDDALHDTNTCKVTDDALHDANTCKVTDDAPHDTNSCKVTDDARHDTNTCKATDDALHDILRLASPAVLDFRTCIPDVEFSLQEDSFAKPPLEALLTDMPLFQDQVQSTKEVGESSSSGQNYLVFIGSEMEAATSEKNNEIWLPNSDFDFSNTEHEVQNFHDSSHASLI